MITCVCCFGSVGLCDTQIKRKKKRTRYGTQSHRQISNYFFEVGKVFNLLLNRLNSCIGRHCGAAHFHKSRATQLARTHDNHSATVRSSPKGEKHGLASEESFRRKTCTNIRKEKKWDELLRTRREKENKQKKEHTTFLQMPGKYLEVIA